MIIMVPNDAHQIDGCHPCEIELVTELNMVKSIMTREVFRGFHQSHYIRLGGHDSIGDQTMRVNGRLFLDLLFVVTILLSFCLSVGKGFEIVIMRDVGADIRPLHM